MSTIDFNSKREIIYEIKDLNLIIKSNGTNKETVLSLFNILFHENPNINFNNFFTKQKKSNIIYIDKFIDNYTNDIIEKIQYEPMNSKGTKFTNYPSLSEICTLIENLSKNLVKHIKSYNLKTIENIKNIYTVAVNRSKTSTCNNIYSILFRAFIHINPNDVTLNKIFDRISTLNCTNSIIYSYNIVALIIFKKILNKETVSETIIERCVNLSPEIGSLVIYMLTQEKVTSDVTYFFKTLTTYSNNSFEISFSVIYYYLENKQPDLAKDFIKTQNIKLTYDNKLDYSKYTYLIKAIHFYLEVMTTTSTDNYIKRAILNIDDNIRAKFLKKVRKNNTLSQICKNPEELLTFLFLKPTSVKKSLNIKPPITQKLLCNTEVFKMLSMFPDFTLPDKAKTLLTKKLETSVKNLCMDSVVTDRGLISYVHEIILALKNKEFKESLVKNETLNFFIIEKVKETPIVLKLIQNELYQEALMLIENGWKANQLLKNNSNAMHIFVKSTEYGLKCTDYDKAHFFNFCSSLMTQGDLLNQENDFKITPVSQIQNISLAKELITINHNSIDIPKLLKASIYSTNVDLAIYLQETFEPDIEVDEDLLTTILNLLTVPGEYTENEGFKALLNVILTKMDGRDISPKASDTIYRIISKYYLENGSFFKFHDFMEELASHINLYGSTSLGNQLINKAPSKDIVRFIKILLKFDKEGSLAKKAVGYALYTLLRRSPDSTHFKEIISLIVSYKKLDLSETFSTIDSLFPCFSTRKGLMLTILELIPSTKNFYIKGKHIALYILTQMTYQQACMTLDHPRNPSVFNYELLTSLIDKFNLDINSIADHETKESIFCKYMREYYFDNSIVESIYKKYKPDLSIGFKNNKTIFHFLTEEYLAASFSFNSFEAKINEKKKSYIESLLKLFCDDYPDWVSYIGETKIPTTNYTMRASPATTLQLTDCAIPPNTPLPLSVDRLSEYLDMLYLFYENKPDSVNAIQKQLNKKNIISSCRPELFINKEKNLRFFYLLCKHVPLSNVNGEIDALLPILKDYINLPYHNGETPFQAAVKHNHFESVIQLIKLGGDTTITLEDGQNMMHYLMSKVSTAFGPQIYNYVKNRSIQLCQFDNKLALPLQKVTNFQKRNIITINSLKKIKNLPETMTHENSGIIKIGNIHYFLNELLPNVNELNISETIRKLVSLGLLNYIPNLIKKPSDLDLCGLSPSQKIMLCFKPKNYDYESLEKLKAARPIGIQNPENIHVKHFFGKILENFRLTLFESFCDGYDNIEKRNQSKTALLQNFADKLGVTSSMPDLNGKFERPDNTNLLFLDYFYIQHQVNKLVFLLQDEFIKNFSKKSVQLVNYLSSLAPKGVNKKEFLSQVINTNIVTQESKLTIYGAMMILVDLDMYEQSEVIVKLLNSLISNKCILENKKEPIESISLPIKRPRQSDESERPNKKQKQ